MKHPAYLLFTPSETFIAHGPNARLAFIPHMVRRVSISRVMAARMLKQKRAEERKEKVSAA